MLFVHTLIAAHISLSIPTDDSNNFGGGILTYSIVVTIPYINRESGMVKKSLWTGARLRTYGF